MALEFCAVVDVLSGIQLIAIREINKKFLSMQRLAAIIEQAGDFSLFLPDLGTLFPLSEIDLNIYTNLKQACPFLNLPAPGEAGITELRAKIGASYAVYIRLLTNHSYLRLDDLQEQLLKVQGKFNDIVLDGVEFISCLQQACETAVSAGAFVSGINPATLASDVTEFTKNFVDGTGQVLSDAQKSKVQDVRDVVEGMNNLLDTPDALSGIGVGDIPSVTL